jgi:hypothetical protein
MIFAVYGGLRGGPDITDNTQAAIVSQALQPALNRSPNGVVTINNPTIDFT